MTQTRDLISASVTTSLISPPFKGQSADSACAREVAGATFLGAWPWLFRGAGGGSGLIFVPAALWLGFTGHWGRAILLLAICASGRHRDNVLRPLLPGRAIRIERLSSSSAWWRRRLVWNAGSGAGAGLVATASGVLGGVHGEAENPPMTAE